MTHKHNGKWRPRKLDQLGFVGRGKSRHRPRNAPELYGGPYPFVQTADIMASEFYITSYSKTYSEAGLAQSKMWEPNTLCMTIAGENTAETAILSFRACFPDSVVGFIADPEQADVRFVKYYLDHIRRQIRQVTRGATQDNLSLDKLLSFDIIAPPVQMQTKIASIAAAYDELILNNHRRIAVLENMAQAIYREWFVNFRFPGHEKVKLINSPLGKIPEGWCASVLGDHLAALETGKRPKGGATDTEGIPSVGAENIISIGKHNYSAEKYVSIDYFSQMTKGIVQDRDVALYKDGAYIGRSTYFRDGFPHRSFCVNEHVFLLRSNGEHMTQNSLYLWLQEPNTVASIRGTNANAAQPGINQKGLTGVKLIAPSPSVAKAFDSEVEPLLHGIATLAKKNRVLRQTRDLLLPKLISGQLDVEELDIETGEPLVEAEA